MQSIPLYGRFDLSLDGNDGQFDSVQFISPTGETLHRPAFAHKDAAFTYDLHGYEIIEAVGGPSRHVRFTPDVVGTWRYSWGGVRAGGGSFECIPSGNPGYTMISEFDSRYFCFSDGTSYVPIGLNICWPVMYSVSSGHEFGVTAERATFGAREYERWFDLLAESGGNFARLWLGMDYFQAETTTAGVHDLLRFAAIDRVVELARRRGIRLKLCLEYFRTFEPGTSQSRVLRHPGDGRSPVDMDEWFQSPEWQALWMCKVDALTARYGDDPVVMAWELWNEIDCCAVSSFEVTREWTRRVLRTVKAASPRNLVTNSLGSFDDESKQPRQDAFRMPEMDFQQVHRYLDQGASIGVVRTDPAALSIDAIRRARRPDRPILLAETGAVNDCHSGPFGYYRWDDDGLIFHDTTYAAFFAGAAGSGHIWHWDNYVDQKSLWPGFRALADAIEGVAVDREVFDPIDISTDQYWALALRGHSTVLIWLRNRADRWDTALRDRQPSPRVPATIDLKPLHAHHGRIRLIRPWPQDCAGEPKVTDGTLTVPPFHHGVIVRVDLGSYVSKRAHHQD